MKGRGRVGAPFVYQTLDALDAIEEQFDGRPLSTAIALYVGLTRLANDLGEGTPRFKAEQSEVARRSGLSVRTVRDYVPKLEAAGVLTVERVDGEAHGWELVEPRQQLPGGSAAVAGVPRQESPGSSKGRRSTTSSSSSSATPQQLAEELHRRVDDPEMIRDAEELLLAKTKVGTRIVTGAEMVIAAAAVTEFNRQQDARHGLAAYLTPIVGRIRERPTWGVDAHVRLVQSAWRIRWWERNGRGRRATPKVIYGNTACFENVVQDAADEKVGKMNEVEKRRGRFERTRSVEED